MIEFQDNGPFLRTFKALTSAYLDSKYCLVIESKVISADPKIRMEELPIVELRSKKISEFFIAKMENGGLPKLQISISCLTGRVKFSHRSGPSKILSFLGPPKFFGVDANLLVSHHLFYPLQGLPFVNKNGIWISQFAHVFGQSIVKLERQELMMGVPCMRFSISRTSSLGDSALKSTENLWIRESDQATQRLEWEIEQSGTANNFEIQKLKLTFFRNPK